MGLLFFCSLGLLQYWLILASWLKSSFAKSRGVRNIIRWTERNFFRNSVAFLFRYRQFLFKKVDLHSRWSSFLRRRITTRQGKVVDKFRHLKFWKTLKRLVETAVREQVFQENTLLAGAADFVSFAPGKVGCVVGCLDLVRAALALNVLVVDDIWNSFF